MSALLSCDVTTLFVTNTPVAQRPSEIIWQQFGAWVKARRLEVRPYLSQAAAARLADMDRQQWYRIESGKSGTRRDTVIRIAKALSADVNDALKNAGYAAVGEAPSRPQTVAEFVQRLFEMGFDIQMSGEDLEALGPEVLQEMIEDIEAKLIVKSRNARREKA
jgi:DNA-binding XRE family transcriptional regulator